jgi:hypothetical protein
MSVGIRMEGLPRPALGAQVSVTTSEHVHVSTIVAGDSFSSQHAPVVHFGLGSSTQVKHIEIKWSNGKTIRIPNPAVNRYHGIRPTDVAKPR